MALISCPECTKKISETVDVCPNCGFKFTPEKKEQAKKSQNKIQIGCAVAIAIAFILGMVICLSSGNKKTEKPKTPDEIRKDKIAACFSPWDGSHVGLTALIKKGMNDPDSYKHEKTTYQDKGDYLLVTTIFRGKNAFGGYVKNWVKAKVDLDGNVLKIIEQGP